MTRTYYGELIDRCGPNSSGMRWYCLMDGVGYLKADTLEGLKSLIRLEKRIPTAWEFQGLAVGDRVKTAPHTDVFMRGVRYARITKIGRKWLHIQDDNTRRVFKVSPHSVDLAPNR